MSETNRSSATAEIARVDGSLSLKVTDVGTNGKHVCDFLLVNNTNLHPISQRCQVTADYWSNLRFRQGVPSPNTLGVNHKYRIARFGVKKLETSTSLCRMVQNAFRCFEVLGVAHCDGQTDRQTEPTTRANKNSAIAEMAALSCTI